MICTHSVVVDSLKNDAIAFRGIMEQLAAIITPSAVRISTINYYSINYTDLGVCLITYSISAPRTRDRTRARNAVIDFTSRWGRGMYTLTLLHAHLHARIVYT